MNRRERRQMKKMMKDTSPLECDGCNAKIHAGDDDKAIYMLVPRPFVPKGAAEGDAVMWGFTIAQFCDRCREDGVPENYNKRLDEVLAHGGMTRDDISKEWVGPIGPPLTWEQINQMLGKDEGKISMVMVDLEKKRPVKPRG